MDKHETVKDLLKDIRQLSSKVQNLLNETNRAWSSGDSNDNATYYREIVNLKWMIHDLDGLITRVKIYEISNIT